MKRTLLKLQEMKNSVDQENFFGSEKLFTKNFQMKTLFILVFVNLFSFAAIAQHVDKSISTSNEATIESNFNLPPNTVLYPKTDVSIDYSYMLESLPIREISDFGSVDFLKDLPKEKLDYFKASDPKSLKYYTDAKIFYDGLSNRVKSIFSVEILWYIYYFDQNLKTKLQLVK